MNIDGPDDQVRSKASAQRHVRQQQHRYPAALETLRVIGILFVPGDVIEIRALNVGRTPDRAGVTKSRYFNFEDRAAIEEAVQDLDGYADGIYIVLNPVNPNLIARANNRLQARPKHTTSDTEIVEWRWMFIDIDPVRPAGISATHEEHGTALARAVQIQEALSARGWPEPVSADSGNGAALLYRLPRLEI